MAFRLSPWNFRSLVITGSQKNLSTSLAIISFLPSNQLGPDGLLTIPCIMAYVTQLFFDSYVASRMAAAGDRTEQDEYTSTVPSEVCSNIAYSHRKNVPFDIICTIRGSHHHFPLFLWSCLLSSSAKGMSGLRSRNSAHGWSVRHLRSLLVSLLLDKSVSVCQEMHAAYSSAMSWSLSPESNANVCCDQSSKWQGLLENLDWK
jgi:hypothetical protein